MKLDAAHQNQKHSDPSNHVANVEIQCVDLGWCDTAMATQDPLSFLRQLFFEHGDCVRYRSSLGRYIVFNHPKHVKEILHNTHLTRGTLLRFVFGESLVTAQGSLWRHRRNLLQPFFLHKYVESFDAVISSVIDNTAKRWQTHAASCNLVEITKEMNWLTLELIVAVLCSTSLSKDQIETFGGAISSLFTDLSGIQDASIGCPITMSPRRNREIVKATRVIDEIIYEILAKRKCEPSPPNDLLTHLINARNENGGQMSEKALRNELVTIILTGHETTAMSLSWAWYLLALNPDSEKRLHREVDEVLGNRLPTIADLPHLTWTEQIIKETMRLYPPIWSIVRQAKQDVCIGGIKVSAGEFPIVCLSILHRHPRYWDNPDRFCPERFSGELAPSQNEAFLPFGLGSHICIGRHISMLEQTMALAALASRFRIKPLAGHEIKPFAGVSLRMQPGFPATLELRNSTQSSAIVGQSIASRGVVEPSRDSV